MKIVVVENMCEKIDNDLDTQEDLDEMCNFSIEMKRTLQENAKI